ncbi:MAG: ATP-dependent RNA helicase HrpB [Alphaproteobacteria bacterium ADurb.BinA280]|nr:MAG: ATP-dependent RNA helicase HrpB [Alphaproteobacteria bacterium ADurb.BinA280]
MPHADADPQRARQQVRLGLSCDQRRLHGLWSAWSRATEDSAKRQAFQQALQGSIAARLKRAEAKPQPTFEDDLPIARESERIIAAIRQHRVVVIAGETGSGKTTQLPKLCLTAGRGEAGIIGCTQPRRIAARSVARRVADELGTQIGAAVGFQVRFNEQVGEQTYIKFMTDGILLAEIQSDRELSRYDTIILDEAHERSLNIDFLLGYLKTLLQRRPDLKLIVTSATIDTERFSKHFDGAPVISVEGRSYPVETRYRALGGKTDALGGEEVMSVSDGILAAMEEINRENPLGDVLIFLPGEREIRETHLLLSRRKYRETVVLPLYARLSTRDQDLVFHPGPQRRIVLATNVAETSLTVPRIRYVIDPGQARVKRYSPRQKLDRLQIEAISQASSNQRAGRCGRIAAGVCFRLFGADEFQSRPAFTDPEILRSALSGVILRMLALGLGRIEQFPFIDAPDPRAINDGWQQLIELGAVDRERRITDRGRRMARLPIDPKLARMLLAAGELGCVRELLAIAAFLSIQDPRERPADAREAADNAHALFADPRSEFIGVLKLWDAYQAEHEARTQSQLRDWCGKHFLSFLRMREWRELHRQLLITSETLSLNSLAAPADYVVLHKAILCGLPAQIGRKNEKQQFEAPRQRRFQLFPGSALARKPPLWVVSAVVMETQKVYGLINAAIEPDWVIDVAAHLLTRRHHDPHWSRSQGRVIASEQISLHGLVLAPKRPISYANIDFAHARQIFIREGLVTGEVNLRIPLLERNQRILQRALEEEAKLRRVGIVIDEEAQAEWYAKRLPDDVASAPELESWYKRLSLEQRGALEWRVDDLLPQDTRDAAQFPSMFRLGEVSLRLSYRFEPGASDDGVTLHVPLHLLNALDARALDWLVPGLLEDRVAELLRGLPKVLRRNFVPVPDFARAFLAAVTPGAPGQARDQLQTSLAVFLRKTTGVEVPVDAWDDASVPAHLRFNLRLSEGRNVLEESRDLAHLKTRWGDRAQTAFAAEAGKRLEGQVIEQFPADGVPEQIAGVAGVPAFPALAAQASEVVLRVFADREAARVEHPLGVRALLLRAVADRIKQARKQLPISPRTGLLYASVESSERLREDLVEAALNAICADHLVGIRSRQAFDGLAQRIGRELFAEATRRLQLTENIVAAYAELVPLLDPPLMGFATANYEDLRQQLAGLVHPGFLRDTPFDRLNELPRFLKGMRLRAERLRNDPGKDQARMLEVIGFSLALREAVKQGRAKHPAWQALRWALEEFRVSLFAQELGTRETVSAKRLAKLLEQARLA